jgi:hypothetical protein
MSIVSNQLTNIVSGMNLQKLFFRLHNNNNGFTEKITVDFDAYSVGQIMVH